MDQYITLEIFGYLQHSDRIKMNTIITCYGSLFENIYELKTDWTFSDKDIIMYKNVTKLNYTVGSSQFNITDKSIRELKLLTKLKCRYYKNITDESIKELKYLTYLDCSNCPNITDESIKELKYLTHLNCTNCFKITDKSIKDLTRLKTLILSPKNIYADDFENDHINYNISDNSIKELKHLETLVCEYYYNITDESIKGLKKLTYLDCSNCDRITNGGIK